MPSLDWMPRQARRVVEIIVGVVALGLVGATVYAFVDSRAEAAASGVSKRLDKHEEDEAKRWQELRSDLKEIKEDTAKVREDVAEIRGRLR